MGIIVLIGDFPRACQWYKLMTGNQVISTMFNNNTFILMVRFVLVGIEMKTMGLPLTIIVIILGSDGDYLSVIYCHIDPHCIGLWLCSYYMP